MPCPSGLHAAALQQQFDRPRTPQALFAITSTSLESAGSIRGAGVVMNESKTGEPTMKGYSAMATLLMVLSFAPSKATDSKPGVGTIGTGTFSCEKFSKYDHARNNSGQMDLVVQWAWGFISAYNARAAFAQTYQEDDAPNPIVPPDATSLLLFIRKHCEKYPQSNVTNATLDLIGASGGVVTSSVSLSPK
jgi:hypothetical protein